MNALSNCDSWVLDSRGAEYDGSVAGEGCRDDVRLADDPTLPNGRKSLDVDVGIDHLGADGPGGSSRTRLPLFGAYFTYESYAYSR